MKSRLFLLSALSLGPASAQTPTDGATLYTLNCAACHMADQGLVGPSLVEIRKLYLDKPDDFVKWAIAPGKKRPGAVEMPSMVHVGEPGLRAIHAHMMEISKGVKEKAVAKGDPFAQSPTQTARPQIQRIFLPNSGPAAIAIALDDKVSLCWDAGECRLRYAWTGGFIDGFAYWKGNGSSLGQIKGKIQLKETAPLVSGTPSFHGYGIKDKLPVLRYSIGGNEITESFAPLPEGKGFIRRVTTTTPVDPAAPPLADTKATVKLTREGSNAFTLTYTFQ
jgi:cytochrome c551/c552